jgi:hypothetical protein
MVMIQKQSDNRRSGRAHNAKSKKGAAGLELTESSSLFFST